MISLPGVGHSTRDENFDETLSLPLSAALSVASFIPYCGRSHLFSVLFFFTGNYSFCSYRCGVSVEGGEFMVLLYCHLRLSPFILNYF